MIGFWQHLRENFSLLCKRPLDVFAPALFSIVLATLLNFNLGSLQGETKEYVFELVQILILFFSLELCLASAFVAEKEDDAYTRLRSQSKSIYTWFFAKWCTTYIQVLLICFFAGLAIAFFTNTEPSFLKWQFSLATVMLGGGLASLGLLLKSISMQSRLSRVVFSLLYYPLASPALLAYSNITELYRLDAFSELNSWLTLLSGVTLLYIASGCFLFGELNKPAELES
jgi:hypothetical protein